MRAISNRAIASATAVAIALTTTGIPAFAATKSDKPVQVQQGTVTDMSAQRKRYRSHRGYNPGGAMVLGAVGTLFGVIAANAARDRYRQQYYQQPYGYYGYGGGYGYQPYAYRPAPYYYGY